jgi:hypothetical protein
MNIKIDWFAFFTAIWVGLIIYAICVNSLGGIL